MTEKRFEIDDEGDYLTDNQTGDLYDACGGGDGFPFIINEYHKLQEENEKLKLQNGELLYQIGEIGKNNKTCRECECFIPKHKYCYMWDMEVEADDVVVACDQRKVKE